jgi:hypothetical protein
VHGLIAALWISLAPPEPARFDEVIDIAAPSAPTSEPAPIPDLEPEPTPEPSPRPVPRDETPEVADAPTLQIATDRRRRQQPPRELREPRQAREPRRVESRPWGKTDEWRAWGAPLLSTFLPGFGQLANGHVMKGVGLLYGTVAALAGAVALYQSDHDGTRPVGAEYARLTSFGVFSTAVPMLWLFAIADAHRFGKDPNAEVEPELEHKLRVSVARTMTVGFRADPDRPGFYDEWTFALIGQVAKRWSVGLSDATLKPDGWRIGVVQFGVRADYRVFDRRRVWIDVALGTAMQVAIRRGRDPLDPDLAQLPTQTKFGAIPYAQVDLRWFVLDRISLDLTPRLSVPLTTRYYSANRSLPRFAPTLELGASASVYF